MRFVEFASRPFTRDDFDRLTEEEEAVIKLRRRGKSIIATGDALGMSEATVKRRQRSAMCKIG